MSASILMTSHQLDAPIAEITAVIAEMIHKLWPSRDAKADLELSLEILDQVKDVDYWWPDFQKKAWLPALTLDNCDPILMILDYLNVEKATMRKVYLATLQHMVVITPDKQLIMTNMEYLSPRNLQQLEYVVADWRRDLHRWISYKQDEDERSENQEDFFAVLTGDWSKWKYEFVEVAAKRGWLPRLKEMAAAPLSKSVPLEGYIPDLHLYYTYQEAAKHAAKNKYLDCLQFITSMLKPTACDRAMVGALKAGFLDGVKLLHAKGCDFEVLNDDETIDLTDFDEERGTCYAIKICTYKDSIDCLKYLHCNGCEIFQSVRNAVTYGAWKCVEYLVDQGQTLDNDYVFASYVCKSKDISLDLFRKLQAQRSLSDRMLQDIIGHCNMDVIRYATVGHSLPECIKHCRDNPIGLELLRYLHEEMGVPLTGNAYYWSHHSGVIPYLMAKGIIPSNKYILHPACSEEVLIQLLDAGYKVDEELTLELIMERPSFIPILHQRGCCYWGPNVWIRAITLRPTRAFNILEYIHASNPPCPWDMEKYKKLNRTEVMTDIRDFLRQHGYIS